MMKPTLSSVLLTYAVLYPILLLSELFGARLPEIVSHANALGFFTLIMISLIMTKEYGRPRRTLEPPGQSGGGSTHPTLLPASQVFFRSGSAAMRSQGSSTLPCRPAADPSSQIPLHPATRRSAVVQDHIATQ